MILSIKALLINLNREIKKNIISYSSEYQVHLNLKSNQILENDINNLRKQIRYKKDLLTMNERYMYNICNHEWIDCNDYNHFLIDNTTVPVICRKCKLHKNGYN